MRLRLLAVGRMKGVEADLAARYDGRLVRSARAVGMDWRGTTEVPEARAADGAARMAAEADVLLAKADGATLIAFDERGDTCSSVEFARTIERLRDAAAGELALAVGGPDGHGEAVRERAVRLVGFGRMTWPHQLARVMVLEQLYRATTILAGHPYHRA